MSNLPTSSVSDSGATHHPFGRSPITPSQVATILDGIAEHLGLTRILAEAGKHEAVLDEIVDTAEQVRALERSLRLEIARHYQVQRRTPTGSLPAMTPIRPQLLDVGEDLAPGTTVLPALRTHTPWLTTGRAVSIAVIAVTTALVTVLAVGGKAHAAVTAAPPVRVVVDQASEAFTAPVRTNSTLDGQHAASVWIGYPGSPAMTQAGSGTSTSTVVPVRGRLDARRVTQWGLLDGVAVDDVDGTSTALTLDVRRRSIVALTHTEVHGSRVAVAARVTHYDPASGTYISSRLSPVQIQEHTQSGWVTVASVTTSRDGLAGALVPASAGAHLYRAVRPDGATVWGATSRTLKATMPGCGQA